MNLVLSVLDLLGRVLVEALTSWSFALVFILLFLLIAWQYRRMEETAAAGLPARRAYLRSALLSTLTGLLAGIVGSVVLVFIGIDLSNIGITQLWLLALLLMLISPRFLCFAYAGGILSLFSLLSGSPSIDIPQLMGLVAVLHMMESLLILVNGHLDPIPVYIQKDGRLRGGFNLQKFWPIPLIALVGTGVLGDPAGGVNMPHWWPLIKSTTSQLLDQNYALVPVLAVLGYGEICTTSLPFRRVKKSAARLFGFSMTLLLLAILASRWPIMLYAAALFAPLGHELVIWLGRREEDKRPALFIQPPHGVMILQVQPSSPAGRAGLRSGDVILSAGGEPVNQFEQLEALFSRAGSYKLEIIRQDQTLRLTLIARRHENWGLIPAPQGQVSRYLTIKEDSISHLARRLWQRLRPR